jgi:EamA domain-containing membrane protein RarD
MFIRATQMGRLDSTVVISSLYPAITVLLARIFLKEHFSRWRIAGLGAALMAVPMIAFIGTPRKQVTGMQEKLLPSLRAPGRSP